VAFPSQTSGPAGPRRAWIDRLQLENGVMVASWKRFGVILLAGAALLGLSRPAQAQFNLRRNAFVPLSNPINPNPYISPNMTLGQFAFNTAVIGRALNQIPPWTAGFNPYTQPIFNTGTAVNPALFTGLGAPGYGVPALTTGLGGLGGAGLSTAPGYGAGALSTAPFGGGFGGGYGGGYGGYPYSYDLNGYTGYLNGAANLTIANAQYYKTIEEARLSRERANQEAIVTRRKIREEAEYERMEWLKRNDPEVVRQQDQQWWLNRARNQAPMVEVLDGRALNTLLDHMVREQGRGEKGPRVELNQDLLKSINVTGADTRGNVGLLKNNGKLDWPLPLQGSEFADSRERLTKQIADAVQQAQFNQPVDAGKLKDMRAELGRLDEALDRSARDNDLLPSQFVEARRFTNQLGDAVRALEDPSVSKFFTGKWAPKGKDVAELVQYMGANGLRFAPAVAGDADAYLSLYHALVAFDAGMSQLAARSGNGGGNR
jgi:hypothetical protein